MLRPEWDNQANVIRVSGRIGSVMYQVYEVKPILLPAKNRIVTLMIEHEHRLANHFGLQCTMLRLKTRFWFVKGRQQVKNAIQRCVVSQRQHARHFDEVPADMPRERVSKAAPFEVILYRLRRSLLRA